MKHFFKFMALLFSFTYSVCMFADSACSYETETFIIDGNSQPPLVGSITYSGDLSKITKKGFIVTTDSNKNTLQDAINATGEDSGWDGLPVNCSNYDCSYTTGEEFTCRLTYLKGNTTYYVRSYIVTNDSTHYSNTVTIQSGDFNRYAKRQDVGNVWYAFTNTLFDLCTDEYIYPSTDGFYYSTNENPTYCGYQMGTSYNTCYKFKTKWNYRLWYGRKSLPTKPVMTLSGNNLSISAQDGTSIYYSVNGDGMRPEKFTDKYSEPITVNVGDVVYCYSIDANDYTSYVNAYKVLSVKEQGKDVTLKGSGTTSDPYLIGTAEELKQFNELLSSKSNLNARLTADIVLNKNVIDEDYNLNGDGSLFEKWTCHEFDGGSFNGAGHKIRGIYVNASNEYVGLFSTIEHGCTIDSLGIEDSYIKGYRHVGGVTSWVRGGSAIKNCYFDGVVIASSDKAGGIAAHMGNTGIDKTNIISNCYNKGKIKGYNHVGGICGSAYSLISTDDDYIENCFNIGTISASWTDCGAICGYADNAIGSKISASASKCYYLDSSCTKMGQGYMGSAKTSTEFADGTVCSLLNAGGGCFHQTVGVDEYPILFAVQENEHEDVDIEGTDISNIAYAVYASNDVTGKKNSQITLPIYLKNSNDITLWQADLQLPTGFSIAKDEDGEPLISIAGNRTTSARHSIATSMLANGKIRILCSSSTNKTFSGTDGQVASITLNVADNVTNGKYPLTFSDILMVEASEDKHYLDSVVSVVTIKNFMLGDVNGDGSIDGADLVGIVNFIMQTPKPGNIKEAADVNEDGVIDGSDYVREVNIILGSVVSSAKTTSMAFAKVSNSTATTETPYSLYTDNATCKSGGQVTLSIKMDNENAITLWQGDLVLPECVTIAEDEFGDPMVSVTGRTTSSRHSIATSTLADGSIRLLCSSTTNKNFNGTSGEVAQITLNIPEGMKAGIYPVTLKNILLVEANETKHNVENTSSTLTVEEASAGINSVSYNKTKNSIIYNISGQRIDKSNTHGIYIKNGKKYIVK